MSPWPVLLAAAAIAVTSGILATPVHADASAPAAPLPSRPSGDQMYAALLTPDQLRAATRLPYADHFTYFDDFGRCVPWIHGLDTPKCSIGRFFPEYPLPWHPEWHLMGASVGISPYRTPQPFTGEITFVTNPAGTWAVGTSKHGLVRVWAMCSSNVREWGGHPIASTAELKRCGKRVWRVQAAKAAAAGL